MHQTESLLSEPTHNNIRSHYQQTDFHRNENQSQEFYPLRSADSPLSSRDCHLRPGQIIERNDDEYHVVPVLLLRLQILNSHIAPAVQKETDFPAAVFGFYSKC